MKIDYSNFTKNFIRALIIRLIIGLYFIRSIHKPDELFQGPEVAHNLVYDQGYLSWQWVFANPIRNPVFPYIFAIPYYIMNLLNLNNNLYLYTIAPRILQAFIGAGFDSMLININSYYNGIDTTNILLFINYTNYCTLTYLSRTYVNGIEALLTMIAFYYWLHRNQNKKNDIISRAIAIFTFVMRGTSVLFWVIVWPYELLRFHISSIKSASSFIIKNLFTIILMCFSSVFVSYLYYGKFVFVELNFFYYNSILGWSSLCGVSPFYFFFTYYLVKGFGGYAVTIYYAVYMILSKKNTKNDLLINRKKQMILILIIQMIFLSTSAHKQLRFLIIEYPFLLVLAVYGLKKFPPGFKKGLIILGSLAFGLGYFWFINLYLKTNTQDIVSYLQNNPKASKILILSGTYQIPHHSMFHKKNLQIDVPYIGFQLIFDGISAEQYAISYPQQYLNQYLTTKKAPSHIIFLKQKAQQFEIDVNTTNVKYKLAKTVISPAMQNLDRAFNIYQVI